ncbi:lectin c-type domain-containing protein [Phthorimaea operculella]|nr:lectin c-type domain-containing protein [Phthorimaea operculella]
MGLSIFLYTLCAVHLAVFTNAQQDKLFFRKDYTYLSDTESFYKIHTLPTTWQEAKKKCGAEGAVLWHPKDEDEVDTVIAFWNQTQQQNIAKVFVGLSDLFTEGVFLTVDGQSTLDVYSNWGVGQPDNYEGIEHCVQIRWDRTLNDAPCNGKYRYICKKALKDLQWNKDCNFSRTDYVFSETLNRCYKFHSVPKNWTEAVSMCHAEQSYLAVINSQAEADFLVRLATKHHDDEAPGLTLRGQILSGFHNRLGEGWKTVKGEDLEASGYTAWRPSEPSGDGLCGAFTFKKIWSFSPGHLNDSACDFCGFFVCEHEITNPS